MKLEDEGRPPGQTDGSIPCPCLRVNLLLLRLSLKQSLNESLDENLDVLLRRQYSRHALGISQFLSRHLRLSVLDKSHKLLSLQASRQSPRHSLNLSFCRPSSMI